MGVFGFIENFFFISLALVFVLVLLLVYHFKNRITIAEKKSESMYGLLTAVVKEIKSLRGMFGMGNEQTTPTLPQHSNSNFEVKSKTDPEVNVAEPANNTNVQKKEVITLEFSASEDKIVVSDDSDADDDLSNESVSDSDSDKSDEEEDNVDLDVPEYQSVLPEEIDISFDLGDNVQEISDIVTLESEAHESEAHESEARESEARESEVKEVFNGEAEPEQPVAPIHTIDQLRKMNINQLKTVVSQIGISADITKLKKPELISLIQTTANYSDSRFCEAK